MELPRFDDAAQLAIAEVRRLFQQSVDAPPELARALYGVRAFSNGLRDIANLEKVMAREHWLDFPRMVEAAWRLAHDAKDRLFGFESLDAEFAEYCETPINKVLDAVNERYGPGLYSSWELVSEPDYCTICDADFRSCDHVPGQWYDGRQCMLRPEGAYLRASAFVKTPRDHRCRLWPWQFNADTNQFSGVQLYALFSLEGDETGVRLSM